ncbi:unnamed protein product [Larinioides sclopetarius]|uniref:Uncharacterized protein n=1 Tax=Larinioides sclopetarius TaxID=280406 RepID=A0AAV2AWL7_9ARAC
MFLLVSFTLGNLVHPNSDLGFSADWSFCETSHGKGPTDGVGAESKHYMPSDYDDAMKGLSFTSEIWQHLRLHRP